MIGNPRMEEIMHQIKEHLKPVIDYGANGNIHHYNRTWEKIDKWFKKWRYEKDPKESNIYDDFIKEINNS